MKDNNINIQSVDNDSIDQLDKRSHALAGKVFLTSTSNFGGGAGIAPKGTYSGFVVLSIPTITTMTFIEPNKYLFAPTQSMATIDEYFVAGAYYPYEFSDITISAGALELIKKA